MLLQLEDEEEIQSDQPPGGFEEENSESECYERI